MHVFVWFYEFFEAFSLYFQNMCLPLKFLNVHEKFSLWCFLLRFSSSNHVYLCLYAHMHVSLNFGDVILLVLVQACHGHDWGCMRKLVTFVNLMIPFKIMKPKSCIFVLMNSYTFIWVLWVKSFVLHTCDSLPYWGFKVILWLCVYLWLPLYLFESLRQVILISMVISLVYFKNLFLQP